MRLLLDTIALICASSTPDRLSPEAVEKIADPDNDVYASAASAWEIATKVRIGKLAGVGPLVHSWRSSCHELGFIDLDVTVRHALRAGGYTMDHRDPFDRLICAQGEIEQMTVVSSDVAFDAFPVTTIW